MSASLWAIIIGAIFVNNFILTRFLGLCPFFGVSKKTKPAFGMGLAVIFVMALASIVTWAAYNWILVPLKIEYLQIIVFILVIATLVQFVELFLKKANPILYKSLGIYLPLITTNCAVLGVALLNVQEDYSFINATVFGAAAGIGFTLALLLMSGIRERLELSKVPKAFDGLPIAFIVAALMSMAFLAFSGMIQ
ncbi:MAG: electron transport complex subunit RsxA [Nanoarchaeota archaeon]|nr:electron transport complex subunit RsxA [Nanoarchaeota archaeon]MBU1004991.1 electron transport complex subunit RsxA [Nanoarchaeota archaeon]MBU1946242.1 electron transport complex subunit RsxA [Nanoarchaeota archaeon]